MTGTVDSSSYVRRPSGASRCEEMEGLRREHLRRLVGTLDGRERAVVLEAAQALGRAVARLDAAEPTADARRVRPAGRRTSEGAHSTSWKPCPPQRSGQAKDPALHLPHRRKMQILFAILLGMFLSALDQTIVGTALPTITARPARQQRAVHLGRHHLPADGHHHGRLLRQAVRHLRSAADAAHRHHDLPRRLVPVRPQLEHGEPHRSSGASRVSAPAPSSPSRSRSSVTCSRPASAASTRACSAPCSASRPSSARCWAAG